MSVNEISQIELHEKVFVSLFQCRKSRNIFLWRMLRQFIPILFCLWVLAGILTFPSVPSVGILTQLLSLSALSAIVALIRTTGGYTLFVSESHLGVRVSVAKTFEFTINGPHACFLSAQKLDCRWYSVSVQTSDPEINPVPEFREVIRLVLSASDTSKLIQKLESRSTSANTFLMVSLVE